MASFSKCLWPIAQTNKGHILTILCQQVLLLVHLPLNIYDAKKLNINTIRL